MRRLLLALVLGALSPIACKKGPPPDDLASIPAVPRGLPPRAERKDPVTPAKVRLGRALFFDDRMSKLETTSCADCHQPSHGWSAPTPGSVNAAGKITRRKSPTVLGAGRHPLLAWDGRAKSLEEISQIAWEKQLSADGTAIAARLDAIPEYHAMFEAAFGAGASTETILRSLAAYLSVLESGDAPYDRNQMTAEAERGAKAFERLGCNKCHAGPLFTDEGFHAVGTAKPGDPGREDATKDEKDRGKFRTPTLRQVASCGPWLHDGSVASLDDVLRKMIAGGESSDPLFATHEVREEDVRDLHAFLDALSGTVSLGAPNKLPGDRAMHGY
ncbi:MAG: cytochrome-c peroxidase [Polyangiales bacterium]